jgi:hypothetical protein
LPTLPDAGDIRARARAPIGDADLPAPLDALAGEPGAQAELTAVRPYHGHGTGLRADRAGLELDCK